MLFFIGSESLQLKIDESFSWLMQKSFQKLHNCKLEKKLEKLDESAESLLIATPWKNPMVCFWLAFLVGGFGADRFYLGQTGLGIAKLLTCSGAGIWGLIDFFTAFGRAKQYNLNMLMTRF